MKKIVALLLAMMILSASCCAFAEEDGPLTPYADTVVVRMMYEDDPNIPFWNGETIDENIVEKMFRDYLNIDFQAAWVVDTTQYATQLNNAIETNSDLPDMFVANKSQVAKMVEYEEVTEMSEIYEQYISDSAREVLEFQNKIAFDPVTIDGGLWALPLPNDFSDEITVMYIRKDWRENLGKPVPTTMDELIDLAIAFATEDPDGNGVDDTFGIATDAYMNYITELIGHPLGAYRGIWLEKEGKLEYSNLQPEYKETLRVINKLYHAGGIDKEFAVKNIDAMANDIAEGKCGIYPGSFWAIYWMLNMSMNNEPDAWWEAYPVLAREDGTYNPRALDTTSRYLVVRKGYEHPEAAVKAINLWQEIWQGQYRDEYQAINANVADGEAYDTDIKYYSPIFFDPPYKNIEKAQAVKDAIASGDGSALNTEQNAMYQNYLKATGAVETDWSEKTKNNTLWQVLTDMDAFLIIKDVYEMNLRYSDFNGPTTLEMAEVTPTANGVTDAATIDIIMADPEDVDALFDKYVEDWYAAGGDIWTEEVNNWYAANK